jgi:hypothetical protein
MNILHFIAPHIGATHTGALLCGDLEDNSLLILDMALFLEYDSSIFTEGSTGGFFPKSRWTLSLAR